MASRFVRILAPRHLAGLRNSTYSKAVKPRFQVGRTFHSSAQCRSGFANVLADAPAPAVQVKTITKDGIELVDGKSTPLEKKIAQFFSGLLLSGPCIFLNGKVFLWETSDFGKNGNWDSWTKDMFEMFEVVVPKPGAHDLRCTEMQSFDQWLQKSF